jgi:mannosyltransferase OCH1-like enzyme
MTIPKIFHSIWVGPNPIPEKTLKFIKHIQELHPDYTFMLWTDKDLLPENFTNLEYIHRADAYAQKSDIMRYEILYNYGGIYLDTDFDLVKNITPLLTHELVLCNEDTWVDHYITTAFIASSKGNPNLKRCMDAIPYCQLNGQGGGPNFETGPWYFRKHIHMDDSVRILPTHVMYPVHFNQRNDPFPPFSDETYGVHYWDHSWK